MSQQLSKKEIEGRKAEKWNIKYFKKQKILSKKLGYNTRYNDYEELKYRWIDMSDICQFITSKLIDNDDYFTKKRIKQLKILLTEIENSSIEEFVEEREFDEVF